VFRHRLRVYRELFREEQLLAHWRYSENEWRAFAGAELAAEKSVKKLIVLITAGFALLYCGLMAVLYPKLTVLMIGVALSIVALIAGAAALSTRISRQRNLTSTGEARIGRHGVWLNGALHTWSGGGSYLVDCQLDNSSDPKCMVFSYAAIERHGAQVHQARVPVPHNSLGEARQVITSLQPDFKPAAERK
jgi:membrane protein implicated in regulation of membrane protease activity